MDFFEAKQTFCVLYTTEKDLMASQNALVWYDNAVRKTSAFQPLGPRLKPRLIMILMGDLRYRLSWLSFR